MRYANGLIWSLVVIVAMGCTPQVLGGASGQPVHDPRDRDYSPFDEQRRDILNGRDTIWVGPRPKTLQPYLLLEWPPRDRLLLMQEWPQQDRQLLPFWGFQAGELISLDRYSDNSRFRDTGFDQQLRQLEDDLEESMRKLERDIGVAQSRYAAEVRAIITRANTEFKVPRMLTPQDLETGQWQGEFDTALPGTKRNVDGILDRLGGREIDLAGR